MRDIFRDKTKVLEIANLGWVPVNDGDWSTITLSLTGSLDESFEGTAHHLVNSYRRALKALVTEVGGDPGTDLKIHHERAKKFHGHPATTLEIKTDVLNKLKKLEIHQPASAIA
jgi:hypothetical protein